MFKNKEYSIVIKEIVYKFATTNQGLRKVVIFKKNGNHEKECIKLHDVVD